MTLVPVVRFADVSYPGVAVAESGVPVAMRNAFPTCTRRETPVLVDRGKSFWGLWLNREMESIGP